MRPAVDNQERAGYRLRAERNEGGGLGHIIGCRQPLQRCLFGDAVAASGDAVLVGLWRDDHAGGSSGAAYLYDTAAISASLAAGGAEVPAPAAAWLLLGGLGALGLRGRLARA